MDFEDSNCHSMSDSFSFYERYMRSFNISSKVDLAGTSVINEVDLSSVNCEAQGKNILSSNNIIECKKRPEGACGDLDSTACTNENNEHITLVEANISLCGRQYSESPVALLENSSVTEESCHVNDKSNPFEVPVTSDDSKPFVKQPIFITSIMENSNNAVDSVPLFCDVRQENVFKLPIISELSFNGTLKHVQKLKPIVDPITALTCANTKFMQSEDNLQYRESSSSNSRTYDSQSAIIESDNKSTSLDSNPRDTCAEKISDVDDRSVLDSSRPNTTRSTGDSQYAEASDKVHPCMVDDGSNSKWNFDASHSSLETSFDSGVRSPDMFSDPEDEPIPAPKQTTTHIKDFEAYEKRKVRKIEEILQGVLPPPSVTILKIDVTEILKRYYKFYDQEQIVPEPRDLTPSKRVSYVDIPEQVVSKSTEDIKKSDEPMTSKGSDKSRELDTSLDKSFKLTMCTESEAKQTPWPDSLQCRYYDVYYNATNYSEKVELLAQRYGSRFVGAETDTSVCVYSSSMQSPNSATKRKALRLKQAKSPGRRLSHLARRRQAFCSAATINEKAQTSSSKMVLIDKNFFPHRKLVNSSEWRSPRVKHSPGKKTPTRKTPGKKTPGKKTPVRTPKTRSGGSSKKKAMRRLLMDTESITRSQPVRQPLKRALFMSPDKRNCVLMASTSSVPINAMKSKRNLFGSPVTESKSLDGSMSDFFLKRKRDSLDDEPQNSRSKVAKSLSFGGDTLNNATHSQPLHRRASEMLAIKSAANMNEVHKKKLLWAVTEALRVHGWRMCSPGFREKASALARLTRRLLTLPSHAARFALPGVSTSDTFLKLARKYVFSIIQGRSADECFQEEQDLIANETNNKLTGYISSTAYEQLKARQSVVSSQVKENSYYKDTAYKPEHCASASKHVLQDKLLNVDTSSNSSGLGSIDRSLVFKSNSMPSFEEAAKMRARRQISFDNVDFPKR